MLEGHECGKSKAGNGDRAVLLKEDVKKDPMEEHPRREGSLAPARVQSEWGGGTEARGGVL